MTVRWQRIDVDHRMLALIAIVLTAVFGDILFGGRGLFLRDLTTYHYPMKKMLHDVLWSGEFPFWNRAWGGGQPMAANPAYALFYPPQWLIFIPSFDLGYRLHILVHFFIAAAGTYLFLRSLKLQPLPSLFGALTFALGGPMLSVTAMLPFFFALSWLPWILLYARRCLLEPNRRDFALAALFLGMQCLVGEPVTVLQTLVLIATYAVYRALRAERGERKVRLRAALVLAMAAAALLIAAVQLVPGVDFTRDSTRAEGFHFGEVASWSLPPIRPAELFFPGLFRHATDARGAAVISRFYSDHGEPFLGDLYLGVAVAILAAAGFLAGVRRGGFVAVLLAGFYVAALGAHTPLLRMLYDLHLVRSLRYPEKFALGATFVLIVWAAIVLDELLRGNGRVRKTAFFLAVVWTVSAVWIAVSVSRGPDPALTISAALRLTPLQNASAHWMAILARGVLLAALLRRLPPRRVAVWGTLLIVLVVADLLYLQSELAPRMPGRYFTETPPVAGTLAAGPSSYRLFHDAEWRWAEVDPQAEAYFAGVDVHTYFWLLRNGMFPRVTATAGLQSVLEEDIDRTSLKPTADFTAMIRELRRVGKNDWLETAAAMANIRYRSRFLPLTPEGERAIRDDPSRVTPVEFVELPAAPRYYGADELVTSSDTHEMAARLLDRPHSRRVAFVAIPAFVPSPLAVTRVDERSHATTIHVLASGRAFLVMSVTPHKYWRATLDGAPVPIVQANVGFSGIVVPAGKHTIEVKYANPLVWIGALISLLAVVGCACLARP
jgi:Bacterial membrane protein YfhO